ncbi:MAG: hypothetical protein K2X43_02510 [Hyphomonadaceae bacterium]|nr:hypothetical protein [Hyphomonadaceae bacterium]
MSVASSFLMDVLSGQLLRLRLFIGGIGAILAIAGAWSMYSGAQHSFNGVHTAAVLVERIEKCTAEFHPKGESRRKQAMPCDQAYAFRRIAGEKKVRVAQRTFATLRFPLEDGRDHTATVEENKVRTASLPVGGQLAVTYDPTQPNDVRARLTLEHVGSRLLMLAGGLILIMLVFLGTIVRRLAGAATDRTSSPSPSGEAAAADWGEQALNRALIARESQGTGERQRRGAAAPARSRLGVAPGAVEPRRQFGLRA